MATKKPPSAPNPVYAAAKQAYSALATDEREFVDAYLKIHDFKLVCKTLNMDEATGRAMYERPNVNHACLQCKTAADLSWTELAITAKATLMEVMTGGDTGIVRSGAAKTALEVIAKTNPHLLAEMGGQEMSKEQSAALVLGEAIVVKQKQDDDDEVVAH